MEERDSIGRLEARFLESNLPPELTGFSSREQQSQNSVVHELGKNGIAFIPDVYTSSEITDLKNYFADREAIHFNDNPGESSAHTARIGSAPGDWRFAVFQQDDISANPIISRVAHSRELIDIAAHYLGAAPTITILTSWWSFPAQLPRGGMQYFHHDRDDFRQVKLFVYLTDVDDRSGPHIFVKKTHSSDVLMEWAQQALPKAESIASFWQWMEFHRKTDETVNQIFPAEWVTNIVGSRGTSFFEDTRGLHRGLPPQSHNRLIFQICYSLMPKLNETYTPIPRPSGTATDELSRYACRLFYKE